MSVVSFVYDLGCYLEILVKFGHILLLAELIIAMEWAFSTIERGFSTINRMITNIQLGLPKERLNN